MPCTLMRTAIGCLIAITCVVAPASACSWTSFMIFFDYGSADLNSPRQKSTLEQFQRVVALQLPRKCTSVTVRGMTDTAEAATPDKRLGRARAEAVRDAMVRAGYPKEDIKIDSFEGTNLLVPTEPSVREPQNRRVEFDWVYGKGRFRCDPASKSEGPFNTCSEAYSRCYWELTDGTICNFRQVPSPNPTTYSVDGYGEKLK